MTLGDLLLTGTARVAEPLATGTPVDDLVQRLLDRTAAADADAGDASAVDAGRIDPSGIDTARRVLLAAGALAAYRRAGHRPQTKVVPTPVAPADPRPLCSRAVERILLELLEEERALLPEAFARVAAAGALLA